MATTKRRAKGAGRVRQLPSGRWQARYYNNSGKLVSAPMTFDTKRDAAAWLADYANSDVTVVDRKGDPTLREYAEAWLATRKKANGDDLKPRTREHYRKILDTAILPALGDLKLSRITPDRVRTWYSALDASAPTLRAHTYSLLRTIFSTAINDDLAVTANPCRIRGASNAKTKHRATVATFDELDALIEAMPARYRAMIVFGAWCGLRFGEVIELRRGDIDLTFGAVRVSRGVVRIAGQAVVGDPKSEAGTRTVSVPPHVLPMIETHLAEHVDGDDAALLFPARHGGHLNPSTFYKSYYPARIKAGRPELRFHDLRHTGATMAADTGATLAELMARMGWSSVAVAMRYLHAAAERDRAIANAMSNLAVNVVPMRRRPA